MNHSWHVHVNPEGGDTHSAMGERCKSLGGHYNPYNVDLAVSIVANIINLKLLMVTYDHDSFYHSLRRHVFCQDVATMKFLK